MSDDEAALSKIAQQLSQVLIQMDAISDRMALTLALLCWIDGTIQDMITEVRVWNFQHSAPRRMDQSD